MPRVFEKVKFPTSGFEVLHDTGRTQAAASFVGPGDKIGGASNKHPRSDQWTYVVEGNGEAIVSGESMPLHPGSLILIEAAEEHEIRNTGPIPLKILNFYGPPENWERFEQQ
eukprot:ANDGO_05796.mRNA.1 hypothetical protein